MSSPGSLSVARRFPLLALLPALLFAAQASPALAQSAPGTPINAPAQPSPAVPSPASTSPATTSPATLAGVAAPTFGFQDALTGLSASAQYRQLQLTLAAAQVQAQAAQAATGFTAGVSGSASYGSSTTTDSTGTATEGTSLSANLTASASLPVLPWSAANLSAQSAARSYAVAQVTFAQAVAALKTAVEQAYGRAVTAQLNLSIAQNSLTLSQRQLTQVTAFQANNNATVQSVQAAQAAVQTATVAVVSAQNELDSSRRALGTLVGRDLSAAVFDGNLASAVAGVALPAQQAALVAAQAFSPALASAQKAVTDAQTAVTTAERNRRLPAATVTAQYGPGSGTGRSGLSTSLNVQTGLLSASYSQPLSSASSSGSASFALGLSASFNVLDPAADGALKVAQLQLQQAQVGVTVQQATLNQGLLDAYSAAQVAAQSILARVSSVTAYTTALDTARARLAAGLSTETDVLNAEIALAQALRDLNSAQIAALTTAAQLSALTGLSGAP